MVESEVKEKEKKMLILRVTDDEIGLLPHALATRVTGETVEDEPTVRQPAYPVPTKAVLKELSESIRKGDISIGSILVEQNKKKRSSFPSPNEDRLAEAVGQLIQSGRWNTQGKTEADLQVPITNDHRILQSLRASGEVAWITIDPIVREAYQQASSIDGSDTDKVVALKSKLVLLGRQRNLSNQARAYLREVTDNIQLNRERHNDTIALRLFRSEHLDLNSPSDSDRTFTASVHREPEGELPRPGQDTIDSEDSSSEGSVTGKRGIVSTPSPRSIPQKGVTVPKDSPANLKPTRQPNLSIDEELSREWARLSPDELGEMKVAILTRLRNLHKDGEVIQ